MFNRMLRIALVCTTAAALTVGCGDDEKSNNVTTGNNNTSTSNNTTTGPNNIDPNVDPNVDPNNVDPMLQCDTVEETCVIGDPTSDNFVCADSGDGPKCKRACDQPQAVGEDKGCTAGAICVANEAGTATFCQSSQCTGWADATSCDAFFPENGGNCFPDELLFEPEAAEVISNGAFLCVASAGGAEGSMCESLNDCAPGLLCDGGECKSLCGADSDCGGDDRCIGDDTARFLDSGVGICDIGCDAFSRGQCPTGQGCTTVSPTDGFCLDVGEGSLGDQCDIGDGMTAPDPQCSEGLQCVNFGEDDGAGNGFGRCVATCSTLGVNQDAWDATCPTSDQNGFGRFVHLDESKPAVDIYVNNTRVIDDLAFGETSMNGMFSQLPTGQITVDIVAGTELNNNSPLLTITPTVSANDAITWGVTPDGADIQVISIPVPRNEAAPASGSVKLRIGHGIPDVTPVDVVAVAANAADLTNEIVLATNLTFGSASGFAETLAGTVDVYVFTAGAARTIAGASAAFEDVVLPADATVTVYARGSTANANLGLTVVNYVSANVSSALPQFCFDLSDEPSPTGGICFDTCTGDQYGEDVCGISDFQCNPFGRFNEHLCFPGGDVPVGGACDPEVGNCDELGSCEARGDGTGVCVSHCQSQNATNANLACEASQTCNQATFSDAFNFGRCGTECTPTGGLVDGSCPANLENCFVNDTDQANYYCSASGATAEGAACSVISNGAFAPNTCEGGNLCANPFRLNSGDMNATQEDPGTCTPICELVSDEASSCPAGTKCGLDWFNAGTGLGFCTDTGDNPEAGGQGDACTTDGAPCSDGSVCLNTGAGLSCLFFCDRVGTNNACPGTSTCEDAFQLGTQLDIGLCL